MVSTRGNGNGAPHGDGAAAPLQRSSLREQARSFLRSSIVTGELQSDRLYTVGEFAERLGVSATPVREALGDLEHDGLVRFIRNRGFVVSTLSEHDLDEIFELRIVLEIVAIRGIGELTPEQRDRYQDLVTRCIDAAEAGDLVGYLDTDRELHHGLVAQRGNERLVEIVDRLRDQTRLYALPQLAAEKKLIDSAREHQRLLDAIVAHDLELATIILRRHLIHTRGLWAGREEQQDAELIAP